MAVNEELGRISRIDLKGPRKRMAKLSFTEIWQR
jgi:hypothetical protein